MATGIAQLGQALSNVGSDRKQPSHRKLEPQMVVHSRQSWLSIARKTVLKLPRPDGKIGGME
jgi:hypothetical protein